MIVKGEKLLTRLKPRALAALPSAVGLRTGTAYEITDYGGNIAVAVNGTWRFEFPFRTTWAGRPPVNLVSPGTELQATDYANQKWICDGPYWRPAQGRVSIGAQWGSYLTPLAVLQNVTSGIFTIPNGNPKVSAGMIIPGSTLRIKPVVKKMGANGTVVFAAHLGTTATSADAVVATGTSTAVTNLDINLSGAAHFSGIQNRLCSIQWVGDGTSQASTAGAGNDGTYNINTTVDQFVIFRCYSGNTSDIYNLIGYEVSLEV